MKVKKEQTSELEKDLSQLTYFQMVWINLKKKDNKEGNVCKKIFEKNN